MEPEMENEIREEEVRKRAAAQREARKKEHTEEILKWRELPGEVFKITEVQELKGGKYGAIRILILERKGAKIKVWRVKG